MSDIVQMHATLVSVDGKGVLLIGKSRSGKSDTALRLIEEKKARLVADDVVELFMDNGNIIGKAPENIRGLLEISGVGLVRYEPLEQETIDLVVHLKENPAEIKRMPEPLYESILGLEIPAIDLYAKEVSALHKIMAVLNERRITG